MVGKHASALAVFVMLLAVLPLAAQVPSQADLYGISAVPRKSEQSTVTA